MLGRGSDPPQRLHHMLGGGVPTPPEASPHARGGVGRGEKGAPLPGSDVRLLLAYWLLTGTKASVNLCE